MGMNPYGWLRSTFYEYCDRVSDEWDADKAPTGWRAKVRWWIAEQVDRRKDQCWTDLADFGLGRRVVPWAPQDGRCAKSAVENGTCYCAKVVREDIAELRREAGWPVKVVVKGGGAEGGT